MGASRSNTRRRIGSANWPDPIYLLWRWLTSVRVAISLIAITAAVTLIGVFVPQIPVQAQGNKLAIAEHVDAQRHTWGPATDILAEFPWFYDASGGIFNLFNQPYWFFLVAILGFSITVCTISRFPPIWRTVRRPQYRVNDAYFERAKHRFDFSGQSDPLVIVRAFKQRHYSVRTEQQNGATYVFADRFQWAQLSTFVMHLALILLVFGTLITKFGGEEFQFWVGEGQSWPLFSPTAERQQVQIIVDDAIAKFNDDGQALDFRSSVRVSVAGTIIAGGDITVNGPLHAAGYRVHQAAYWENGAALQVRDVATNQLLYSETLMLEEQFFGPRIRINHAVSGELFADEVIQLSHEIKDLPGAAYQLVPLSDETDIALILVPNERGDEFNFYYNIIPATIASESATILNSKALNIDALQPVGPHIRVFDNGTGELLSDGVVALNDSDSGVSPGAKLGILHLPLGDGIVVGYEETGPERRFFYFGLDDELHRGVLEAGQRINLGSVDLEYIGEARDGSRYGLLQANESQRIGQVIITYEGSESVFFGSVGSIPGGSDDAFVLLERFGQARTAEQFNARGGENVELARFTGTSAGGQVERLSRIGVILADSRSRFDLDEGQAVIVGDYEYYYAGPREFTGLTVRRDPGAIIFWVAIILGILGMTVTFFIPRRRVWAKVTPERTFLAGLAGHGVSLRSEFKRFARDVGALDRSCVDDRDEED